MTSRELIDAWMNAVNARDVAAAVALYAEDAVMLPTFAPKAIRKPEDRVAYFSQLAARPGLHVRLHERTLRLQPTGPGWEVASGIYQFELEVDEEPLIFEARFSFVIELGSPRPIRHHHSSQIPRTLS